VLAIAVEALVAAAEEDAATGGPDLRRGIYPNVVIVGSEGITEIPDERIADVAATVVGGRP
jgi:proteasome beta subunit